MEIRRTSFQGVSNIIRFNRHFYVAAGVVFFIVFMLKEYFPKKAQLFVFGLLLLAIIAICLSLIISFYIYDKSDLYQLNWLLKENHKTILNINAGFDETSQIIKSKFPDSQIITCDFYDPQKHTEISIKRARELYPPAENVVRISTGKLPFMDGTFDCSLAILSAHEIRNEQERICFFKELNRITKSSGKIFVTEHLRNINNFMAYTIGAFHFYSKSNWLKIFEQANLIVIEQTKTTPFITTFILEKNGNTF